MKEDKNMFFHGRTLDPHPHKRGLSGLLSQTSPQACGVAGLIKNIFLSSFMCLYLQSFFNICHADAVPPSVCHQDNCVAVEVVSTTEDMERGLMYRTSLGQNKGMLFVFASDDKQQFWMKNMHFSLDMLWISHDSHIVYIGQNIPACMSDPCPVYSPDQNARYVLELNSGYTAAHQWKVGDELDLKGIIEK